MGDKARIGPTFESDFAALLVWHLARPLRSFLYVAADRSPMICSARICAS